MPSFLPKNVEFYSFFIRQAELFVRASELLGELCANPARRDELVGAIREVEHQGDRLTRDCNKLLVKSFITPLEREDIHALTSALDDLLDNIDDAANGLVLFQVQRAIPEYIQQVELLKHAAKLLVEALGCIEAPKSRVKAQAYVNKIYDLESQGDGIHNQALARLFTDEKDCIAVLKWKELCGYLEGALDTCQTAGNIIEMIVLKGS